MNIEELIENCKAKDRSAEKELYYLYAQKIYGICRRYTQDDQRAEDYMQDTFQKVFSNLSKYDSDKGSFQSWVIKIAVNTIYSDKRKKRVNAAFGEIREIVDPVEGGDIDDNISIYDITETELLTAIRKLPDGYRDVVNLYVFEEWSHKEIATMLEIKESSSRSRYTRAKQLLKTILSKKLPTLL